MLTFDTLLYTRQVGKIARYTYTTLLNLSFLIEKCFSPKTLLPYVLALHIPHAVISKIQHCLSLHLQYPTAGSNFI